MPTPRSLRHIRINARDHLVLDQMIRFQAVTAPLLRTEFMPSTSRTQVYSTLARLVRAGLLEDLKSGPSNRARPMDVPALYVPTKAAYQYRGSPLAARSVPVSRVHHTLVVAQVGLDYVRRGYDVVSDREMQQQRAAARHNPTGAAAVTRRWLTMDTGGLMPTTHVPDLVVTQPNGSPQAVEVELSRKTEMSLQRVLHMYATNQLYREVEYVVLDDAMAKTITTAWNSMLFQHGAVTLTTRVVSPAWH